MAIALQFRLATKDDLFDIVQMLADDPLGAAREKIGASLSDNYLKAFEKIMTDPNQELTIVEMNGEKVATFHLTFIQCLTYPGGRRAQIEAVRTNSKYRGQGSGPRCLSMRLTGQRKKVVTCYNSLPTKKDLTPSGFMNRCG